MKSKLSRSARPDRKQFVEDPFGPYRLIDTHSVDAAYEALSRMTTVRSYTGELSHTGSVPQLSSRWAIRRSR